MLIVFQRKLIKYMLKMFDPDQVGGGFLSSCILCVGLSSVGENVVERGSLTLWLERQNVLTGVELLKEELEEGNCLPFQGKRGKRAKPNTKQKQIPQSLTVHQVFVLFS